jgi:hypothetical protein
VRRRWRRRGTPTHFVALWLAASGVKTAGRRSVASSAARVASRVGSETRRDRPRRRHRWGGRRGRVGRKSSDRPRQAETSSGDLKSGVPFEGRAGSSPAPGIPKPFWTRLALRRLISEGNVRRPKSPWRPSASPPSDSRGPSTSATHNPDSEIGSLVQPSEPLGSNRVVKAPSIDSHRRRTTASASQHLADSGYLGHCGRGPHSLHPNTDHIRRRNEAFVFLLAHALKLGVPGFTEPAADLIV